MHVTSTLAVRSMVTGVAVLAVGVVAWPALHDSGHHSGHDSGHETGHISTTSLPAGAVTGDVDGDGRADAVWLTRDDTLHVRLGSGSTVSRLLQDRPRLEGLAAVGRPGLALVVSHAGPDRSRTWTVWRLHGDSLAPVPTRARAALADRPGSSTAWVVGHRLYDGTFDPLQQGADRVAVLSRAWALHDGVLESRAAGVRCWDRSTPAPPRRCAAGEDWSFDVGPHGSLPTLLPTVHPAWAASSHATFGSETWLVRGYRLVHQSGGTMLSMRVPKGWAPRLFRSPVRLADGSPAVLLSQEGGDSDTWRVYADLAGQVRQLRTRGPLALGGGFTRSGKSVVYSWLTPEGRLFTRVGSTTPGHFRVYAWRPTGSTSSRPPTLVAHDLGTVCIDETLDTYGTC